jgi:hypothetical protein
LLTDKENQKYFDKTQVRKYIQVERLYSFLSKPSVFKHLKIIYNMVIKKICPIYTYIKVRQDTLQPNPRYSLTTQPEIKLSYSDDNTDPDDLVLLLTYFNSDEALPFYDKLRDREKAREGNVSDPNALEKFKANAKTETYYIGPVTGYFTSSANNVTIARDVVIDKNITQKIIDGKDVIIIGNGQSGSGKTSTLVYLRDNENNIEIDGIIPIMCNGDSVHRTFNRLQVSAVEIYVNWDNSIHNYRDIKRDQYFIQNLRLKDSDVTSEPKVNKYELVKGIVRDGDTTETHWLYTEVVPGATPEVPSTTSQVKLSKIIDSLLNRRLIAPTKNNPDSSRSHVLILIEFFKPGETSPHSKMVICDLAGVEDRFKCGISDIITSFDKLVVSNTHYKQNGTIKLDNTVGKCALSTNGVDAPFTSQQGGLQAIVFNEFANYKENKNLDPKAYRKKISSKDYVDEVDFSFDIRDRDDTSKPNHAEHKNRFDNYDKLKTIMQKYASEYPGENLDLQSFIDKFFVISSGLTGDKLTSWKEFMQGTGVTEQDITNLSKSQELKTLLEYMLYNCLMRRYEGYIINKSLGEMRSLITNLTFGIIRSKLLQAQNPLFFLIPNVYTDQVYCYGDNYANDNNYEYFYGENNFDPTDNSSSKGSQGSIIFDIMFGNGEISTKGTTTNLLQCGSNISDPVSRFDLNLSNVSISLVTMINLTAQQNVNNPPNPPFINVNKLKQIINILRYFKDIKKKRPEFYRANFENLFKPVLVKIRDYLVGKYEDIGEIVNPDPSREDIVSEVKALLNVIRMGKSKNSGNTYRSIFMDGENFNTKLYKATTQEKSSFFIFKEEQTRSFTEDEFIQNVSKLSSKFQVKIKNLPNSANFTFGSGPIINSVYNKMRFNLTKRSHFNKIGNEYVFYKNTFASNPVLDILYTTTLFEIQGGWGLYYASTDGSIDLYRKLKLFELFIKITNDDNLKPKLETSLEGKRIASTIEPIISSIFPNNTIPASFDIIDLYQALAQTVLDVIESSNPATLIGTVDFQEYTQFRDTGKLYLTCDGKNNSWQIDEKANENFETQPLVSG